jgi:hypothetical protein
VKYQNVGESSLYRYMPNNLVIVDLIWVFTVSMLLAC